jgi:hypothetical protein
MNWIFQKNKRRIFFSSFFCHVAYDSGHMDLDHVATVSHVDLDHVATVSHVIIIHMAACGHVD